MKPKEIEVGVVLITTEDILNDGKVYIAKNTHCEIIGIHKNSDNMHVRVSENEVLVMYYNSDPYITLEEFNRRNRDVNLNTLIDKDE